MKLKLLVITIIVSLLAFVVYQKYTEYSSLRSIDSYESCAATKGSVIQESYPATCITRLGIHFTQPTPNITLKPQSTSEINIPQISQQDLQQGWYWGDVDQKKPGTPSDWRYSDLGKSSCWHKPSVICSP
ncbi:hypothetical protein COT54_02200 [Candidatus Collierbacteria bacterium CG09_land_8_20_14_0_10_46_12]|uniref:Uncharacterized protein n=1 Tax=Candidatus Collierbacteria bacterium CG09_land_8_20_14_0_10_46_12 TaxID=1974533 RepID=A0A2H0WZ11_9BACT|nr:MAG: hypothetical protein COT54_02200 [Candidatus Collierbacteria bacterium CG09_land_8_20_14_0_10_46_12]